MTSSRFLLALAASAALTLGLSACSTTTAEPDETTASSSAAFVDGACADDEGVSVIVDAGNLAGADEANLSVCVFADATLAAAQALEVVGITVEGTEEYGDQVVCRVDGLPSATDPVGSTEDPAYVESCESMPAAFAYWSLWVKPSAGEWDYAQEGLSTLTLEPGESLELLFTLDGEPAAPAA
ncbi:MAG: hypothetical protein QM622_09015 [Microbacterium sp.]